MVRQAKSLNGGWVTVSGDGQDDGEDASLQEILSLAFVPTAKRTFQRSPLYDWLWARHDTLAAALNPPRLPNWTLMAEGFAKQGIMDGKGKPPTPTVLRKTWGKVNQAKGVRLRQQRGKNLAPVAAPLAAQAHAIPPTPATTPMPAQLPPGINPVEPPPPEGRYQFRLAGGLKKWGKDEPKPE